MWCRFISFPLSSIISLLGFLLDPDAFTSVRPPKKKGKKIHIGCPTILHLCHIAWTCLSALDYRIWTHTYGPEKFHNSCTTTTSITYILGLSRFSSQSILLYPPKFLTCITTALLRQQFTTLPESFRFGESAFMIDFKTKLSDLTMQY